MTRSIPALLAALLLAGCHATAAEPHDGGGTTFVDDEQDSGPPLRDPNLSDTLGPYSGEFDVSGSGELFVIQVDDRVGLQLNGQPNLFIGTLGGDGALSARLVYPELETCGPVTLQGSFDSSASYTATQHFCASDQPASGQLHGSRYIGAHAYKQNLLWSGAYDVVESPAAGNGCSTASGSHNLTLGVARDLDGGASTVLLVGDGLKEEVVFGAVDDQSGVLSAQALDPLDRPTSSFSLFFQADGSVAGTRHVDLGTPSAPCAADLQFTGAKR